MKFKPFDRMQDHIETQKDISDEAYFNSLMYFGEMLTKFTVAAMVSAVDEGRDRHQYRLKHRLVKADGIGVWSQVLDEILTGVPAQHLFEGIKGDGSETNQLTKRTKSDEWQYKNVTLLFECLKIAEPDAEPLPKRIQGKSWFSTFARLRNKTRGHGALSGGQLSLMCPYLYDSITTFVDNFRLYQRPWAYLAQTLKRKYYVVRWTEEADILSILKTRQGKQYSFIKGVHILFGDEITKESLRITDLISSDVDAKDFFLPNGGWNGKRYEMLSYITGKTREADATDYLTPITELPPSETQGLPSVVEKGGMIFNMPPKQAGYISRRYPEENLYREIVDDNQHRIITLIGRGGIGKTWLTLEVLNKIAKEGIFDAILWFSARDIDLLPDSAKQVKPHILDEVDIAKEFTKHIGSWLLSTEAMSDSLDSVQFLRKNMHNSEFGKILFVFDNFETVKSPTELFTWIDHYLRLPNKALITTRFREFRGDYPVELEGMSFEECKQLIDATASRLKIKHLITSNYEDELHDASDGHPYVVKILLGEVRKTGRTGKVEKILANYDDVLNTLFERTYTRLPLVAQRVFLTLCSWKSLVAETAIQAVLLRPENEMTDISEAIDDLQNSSLIEKSKSESDNEIYWAVPLVARQFGLRKLETNIMQMAIDADKKLLQHFGATQEVDVKHGMQPIINRLFRKIETRVLEDSTSVNDYLPIIESVARRYPHTWLRLADLYLKIQEPGKFEGTLKRYIESSRDNEGKRNAWQKLARFYQTNTKYAAELFARIQLAQLPDTDYEIISEAANRFNNIVRQPEFEFEEGVKKQTVQLLINLMESRGDEADATDFSRLGWLYMHNNQLDKAEETAKRGLKLDENNHYCKRLLDRIQNGR